MAIDPVCKMHVDRRTAAAESEYGGKTYFFCAEGCRVAFDQDPERYVGKPKRSLFSRLRPLGKR